MLALVDLSIRPFAATGITLAIHALGCQRNIISIVPNDIVCCTIDGHQVYWSEDCD